MKDATSSSKPSLLSHAINWGALLAGAYIVSFIVLYALNAGALRGWGFMIYSLAVSIGGTVWAGLAYRKDLPEFPYKRAFYYTFVLILAQSIIGRAWEALMFFVIDPDLVEVLIEYQRENANFARIDPEQFEEQLRKGFSVRGQLLNLAFAVPGSALFALILGLFVRRSAPKEEEVQ